MMCDDVKEQILFFLIIFYYLIRMSRLNIHKSLEQSFNFIIVVITPKSILFYLNKK